jgi:hypothetical protein
VVASEERGDVTLMHDGAFRRVESADAMLIELETLFAPEPTVRSTRYFRRSELLLQSVATALAVVIVAATSLVAGTIVRVRTVPIQTVNLAPGLRIVDQPAVAAHLRLRGSSWAVDSIEGALLTARADVHNLSAGVHEIGLRVPGPLPLGVRAEAISPERITLRLRPVKDAELNSKPEP